MDGVYRCDADGAPSFIEAGAPTDDELHAMLQIIIARLMKMLTRRGVLVEDLGQTYLAEPDADGEEARTLRPLQAAAITYRIAFGHRAGQKVLTLRGTMPPETTARQALCADIDGFTGVFVEVAVTVQGITLSQIHPVLDGRNRPILAPTCFDINTSIQRALVKSIALHGLGLYIYAGEDLPQIGTEPAANDPAPRAEAPAPEPRPKLLVSGKTITVSQQVTIRKLAVEVGVELPRVLEYFGVRDLAEIAVSDYLRVVRSLEQRRAA